MTSVEPPACFQRLVAKQHPHMRCISFDLPAVEPIARKTIAREGLSDRIQTAAGDFFNDPLPKADVVTMGMILHDWNLEKKKHLIKAAYDACRKTARSSPWRISSTTSGAKTRLASSCRSTC